MKIIDFGCSIWIEDPTWSCIFDSVNGDGYRHVRLGVLFHVQDTMNAVPLDGTTRPWAVISQIYPLPEELSTRRKKEIEDCMGGWKGESHKDKVVGLVGCYSGVPFDPQAIKETEDTKPRIPEQMPTCFDTSKTSRFVTAEDARIFCRNAVETLPELFRVVDFFLDQPINLMGETGWEYIRSMVGR